MIDMVGTVIAAERGGVFKVRLQGTDAIVVARCGGRINKRRCNSLVVFGGIADIGMRWARKARLRMTRSVISPSPIDALRKMHTGARTNHRVSDH
jgi:hypothetical protein